MSAWLLFITGVFSVMGPLVVGLVTGNLIGSINSSDAGVVWFWRHGIGFLIGIVALSGAVYAVRVRRTLDQ